jgi:thiamine phosphate synthase YjbQ (UPF0047 family)
MTSSLKNEVKTIHLSSRGNSQILDLTREAQSFLSEIEPKRGLLTVSVVSSTAGITTMEFEPGLVKDIPEMLDKIAPEGNYHHDQTWNDGIPLFLSKLFNESGIVPCLL